MYPPSESPCADAFVRSRETFAVYLDSVRQANLAMSKTESDTRFTHGDTQMHDILVAGTFILMVLSPCLVAMRSGAMGDKEID